MLIGFSVKNFRSIRDEAFLSLEASNYYKENRQSLIGSKILGLSGTNILPTAAIYGANASGKTTLLAALQQMRAAVLSLAGPDNNPIVRYQPFLLDNKALSMPTVFSIEFAIPQDFDEGSDASNADSDAPLARYTYTFSYSATEGIVDEKLVGYLTRLPRTFFLRHKNEDGSTRLEGSSSFPISSTARELIGSDTLVLSFYRQAGSAKATQVARRICDWFQSGLFVMDNSTGAFEPYSAEILDGERGSDYQRAFIKNLMRHADTGISDVDVRHVKNDIPPELAGLLSEDFKRAAVTSDLRQVRFVHQGMGEQTNIPESTGTQRLFVLSGHIANALESGATLAVDEIDSSLHPDLANEIISLFLRKETNPRGAQLIFTAQNTALMDNDLMRRDEFWFTRKDEMGATELYPLSDFKVQGRESIQAGYRAGKYAGIPNVTPGFGLSAD